MPTLWSRMLIPTLREVPAEAEVPSHILMLRAGLIRKLGSGVYSYLPLGWRSLHKAMTIVRQEMNRAGALEVFLPALVPLEIFKPTGRDVAYGDNLFRLQDRHGRQQALGPTHEEVITELVAAYVQSYTQLPLNLYQIQTKYRDEFRPRFGVLRSREFQMKDAYSFHAALDGPGGLAETYQLMYDAYCRIFKRCGLPYVVVEAESGPIGGSASHEFMVPCDTGEDTILESDKANYAANVEKCAIGPRPASEALAPFGAGAGALPAKDPTGDLAQVHTPDCAAIQDVCAFFKKNLGTKLKASNILKTLVYEPVDEEARKATAFIIAVVRGDHEVNPSKLKAACGLACDLAARARAANFAIGFVGPHALLDHPQARLFIDPDAAIDQFWVSGANQPDHHVKHFHWKRDLLNPLASRDRKQADLRIKVADLRNAADGDPSPLADGGVLRQRKGIEIGHVFKLGDKYTRAMNVTVLGADQQRFAPIMGCYGIGVNRILAAAIERPGGSDEFGIVWPASIAPYQVVITTIRHEGQARDLALKLAGELETVSIQRSDQPDAAIDVIIDDRDERPGVKFKDADLVGIPVRITLGDKALAQGQVEVKARNASNGPRGELVGIDQAVAHVARMLAAL